MTNKNKYPSFRKVTGHNKNNRVGRFNSSKILIFSLMGVFLVFSLLYLFQTTNQTVTGFIRQDLEEELVELRRQNEDLNIEAMKLSEIKLVNMKSMAGMVKVAQVEYLEKGDAAVAMAR